MENDINRWLQTRGCKEELPGRYRKAAGCGPSSPPFSEIFSSPEVLPMPWSKNTLRSTSFNPFLYMSYVGCRAESNGSDGVIISMLWLWCPQTSQSNCKTCRNKGDQCMVDSVPHNFVPQVRLVVPGEVSTRRKDSGQPNCREIPT